MLYAPTDKLSQEFEETKNMLMADRSKLQNKLQIMEKARLENEILVCVCVCVNVYVLMCMCLFYFLCLCLFAKFFLYVCTCAPPFVDCGPPLTL